MKRLFAVMVSVLALGSGVFGGHKLAEYHDEQQWSRACDGKAITEKCTLDNVRYSKYVYHEAEDAVVEKVYHPAVPAKTHTIHHDAVWDTLITYECQETTISYKSGTCALSQCWDGEYSGSAGRGTCSYHGGVMRSGGPWYYPVFTPILVADAWDEVVVDVPAQAAYYEDVIVVPAKEAYYEKVEA